jgi:DNA-binding GntR family transcriptional regulator
VAIPGLTAPPGARAAYDAIRRSIVEGEHAPGERLVEQRLAERHGLSRTPVREALKALEADGLVRIEPHRGAVVRPMSIDDVRDIYELRAELKGYAARRAATRIDAGALADIAAAIEQFDSAAADAAQGDLARTRAVNAANRRIHDTIVAAAAHERLAQLLHRTVDVPLVFDAFRRFTAEELQRSNQFHRLLHAALARGDGPRAEALMREHIAQGRDVLLDAMQVESTVRQVS